MPAEKVEIADTNDLGAIRYPAAEVVIAGKRTNPAPAQRTVEIDGDLVKGRFWGKVFIPSDPSDCWLWTSGRDRGGYGRLRGGGRGSSELRAHRVSWTLAFGPISKDMLVCHRCDNPTCVNPQHLFLGTHLENIRDAKMKGRLQRFSRRGVSINAGEKHGQAKLTSVQVLEIRQLLSAGVTQRKIATQFKVWPTLISKIHMGQARKLG